MSATKSHSLSIQHGSSAQSTRGTRNLTETNIRSPWIAGSHYDLTFFIGPSWMVSFFVLGLALFLRSRGESLPSVGPWGWLFLVVAIDVAHVYSTLYRTYLDPKERSEHGALLLWIPLFAWILGVFLYSIDVLVFWRVLAYVAVFHFMRQQYGFLALYSAGEMKNGTPVSRGVRWIETSLLYSSMLYPIAYWHTHLPREFDWFIRGDFIPYLPRLIEWILLVVFLGSGIAWCGVQARHFRSGTKLNLPKVLLILGTALSWNLGIVVLNSDFAFTITNVISHGVPYLALVWWNGRKTASLDPERRMGDRVPFAKFYSLRWVGVFFGFLFLLAYLEEGFWDVWFWHDHATLFSSFQTALSTLLGDFTPSKATATLLVPLLSLPQATHYALDGFIWKLRKPQGWQRILPS